MKTKEEATTTENTANVAAPGADVAPEKAPSKKVASQKKGAPRGQRRAKAAKRAAKPHKKDAAAPKPTAGSAGTAKAKVIAMLQRKGGATLDEIMKATGWLPHTTRGFISVLGSKDGLKIESRRREDGARVYEVVR